MPAEAQRTLVKSPPELWAELSDPSSLARHLGDFGEIRTTRVEPETTVEWEADAIRGTVQLKPSGWGTRVTLTVLRDTPEPEVAPEPELEVAPEPELELEPELESEVEPGARQEPEPEPRPGFFARLFRRRRKLPPAAEPPPAEAESLPDEAKPLPEAAEPPNLAAELARIEQAMAAQDAALLTAVLDRLGAAHHRPFSRG
jgi:hypothetical protein